jgi:hypothetical protein
MPLQCCSVAFLRLSEYGRADEVQLRLQRLAEGRVYIRGFAVFHTRRELWSCWIRG